jgi:hypothetical protein
MVGRSVGNGGIVMSTSGNDGSVTFSTKVDESGFNAGLKNLSASIAKIGSSFKLLGSVVVGTISTIAKIAGAALVAALGGLITIIAASIRGLWDLDGYAKDVKTSFENLKLAFATAFQPLVTAALPIIQTIISWMTRLLTIVQMYVAAFLGQKTIMQATANTAASAAKSTGQMAKNTKEAGKAAAGALANFDEISVLQMNKDNQDSGGAAGAIPDVAFQTVPIEQSVLSTVGKIQQWFADTWKVISDGAAAAWNWIVNIWNIVAPWFKINVIDPLVAGFQIAWNWLITTWGAAGQWFRDNFIGPISEQFNELVNTLIFCGQEIFSKVISPMIGWFQDVLWPIIQKIIGFIVEIFKSEFDLIVKNLGVAWDLIVSIFQNAFLWIGNIVTGAMQIFQGLIEFFTGIFTANWSLAWKGIQDIATGTWNQIYATVKLIVNSLIDLINGMVAAMVNGLNTMIGGLNTIHLDIPEAAQKLLGVTGGKWSLNIAAIGMPAKIPHLATGAVIPANAPFAAILGDQKSGTNIEAPADLIRQIVREEMGGQGNQQIAIKFTGSMGELIRILKPEWDKDDSRIGGSLVSVKAGA